MPLVMVNVCHRQQRTLYVPVFERNYTPRCSIAANLHSFHTLHINGAFKQKNVRLQTYSVAGYTDRNEAQFLGFCVTMKHFTRSDGIHQL